MPNAKQLLDWAKEGDVHETVAQARREAARRGHGQRTALAGAGGLIGGILGSFRGPSGAAFGAFVGALLGALFGMRRDRAVPLPTTGRRVIDAESRTVLRSRAPHEERDYVEVR